MSGVDYDFTKGYLQQGYQEAQKTRQVALLQSEANFQPPHPGWLAHLGIKAGKLLVIYGLKLKERYWVAAGRPRHFFILDLDTD